MAGKYLRKIQESDVMRDPTMTYMLDPHKVQVGDVLRDEYGYDLVTSICDNVFNNPDIRFAELTELGESLAAGIRDMTTVHDLREEVPETARYGFIGLSPSLP